MRLLTFATTAAARLLPPNVQDAVLGDLDERNASAFERLFAICDVILHRKLKPWRSWQPWAAGAAVFPAATLLLTASFSLALDLRPLLGTRVAAPDWPVISASILLLGWSLTTGFAIGALSRRTAWASAALCAVPCISCTVRFHEPSISRWCDLVFLAPALIGAIAGIRLQRLRFTPAILAAASITGLMFAWIGMCQWFWPLVVPAWFLVATAHEPGTPPPIVRNKRRIIIHLVLFAVASLPLRAQVVSSQILAKENVSRSFVSPRIDPSPETLDRVDSRHGMLRCTL